MTKILIMVFHAKYQNPFGFVGIFSLYKKEEKKRKTHFLFLDNKLNLANKMGKIRKTFYTYNFKKRGKEGGFKVNFSISSTF